MRESNVSYYDGWNEGVTYCKTYESRPFLDFLYPRAVDMESRKLRLADRSFAAGRYRECQRYLEGGETSLTLLSVDSTFANRPASRYANSDDAKSAEAVCVV